MFRKDDENTQVPILTSMTGSNQSIHHVTNDSFDRDLEAGVMTAIPALGVNHQAQASSTAHLGESLSRRQAKEKPERNNPTPHVGLYHRSLRVTWQWFAVNMSTGAMASLMGHIPFRFKALRTIGEIFYIVNMATFCLFSVLILTRFVRKPRAFPTSLHHPSESFFFGGFWVAVALLINGMQTYGVPRCGPWLPKALRIIFWIYYGCATCVAIFQYHIIFHVETLTLTDAMPAWVLPTYPFLVTGVVASNIAKSQTGTAAVQIVVGGLAAQGLGWIIALFIYTVYLTRLIGSKLPPPSMRPGLYISVGPAAYTCAGILLLGLEARKHTPDNYLGIVNLPVGDVWYAMSVPAGIFLWLLCMWFSSVATLSIVRDARLMSFSLSWWAFVFPNAGMAIATIQVGTLLNSEPIKMAACVIAVVLVPLWLMCAVLHVRAIYRHELLAPGKDIGVDDVNRTHDVKHQRALERKRRRREMGRGWQSRSPWRPSSQIYFYGKRSRTRGLSRPTRVREDGEMNEKRA